MKAIIPIVWLLAMFAARFVDPLPVIAGVALAMAAMLVWRERGMLQPLLRVTPTIAALAILSAAAMIAVTYLAFPLLVRWFPPLAVQTQALYSRFLAQHTLAILIAGVVPVVVAEEVVWRGAFQGGFVRYGVLGAALTYALVTAPAGSLLLVVVALVCGLYWSALRAISGSLIPPLCAHLAWDLALILFPLVPS